MICTTVTFFSYFPNSLFFHVDFNIFTDLYFLLHVMNRTLFFLLVKLVVTLLLFNHDLYFLRVLFLVSFPTGTQKCSAFQKYQKLSNIYEILSKVQWFSRSRKCINMTAFVVLFVVRYLDGTLNCYCTVCASVNIFGNESLLNLVQ